MNRGVISPWIPEGPLNTATFDHYRALYLDSCSGYVDRPELCAACAKTNTEIRYFSAKITHVLQACARL